MNNSIKASSLMPKAAFILAAVVLAPVSTSYATPFTTDISISASSEFDTASSFGNTAGSMDIISGGLTSSTTFAGDTATGSNPLSGALTDIGDGTGASASVATTDDEFLIGVDIALDLSNSSTTDTFEVTFGFSVYNYVFGDSADAYSDSEIVLYDSTLTELFFSDIISDSINGDSFNGVDTGTSGDAQTDDNTASPFTFTIELTPGATTSFSIAWTAEGGEYDNSGAAELESFANLEILSVTNTTPPKPPGAVPVPSTILLMGLGLLGLPLLRKVRGHI